MGIGTSKMYGKRKEWIKNETIAKNKGKEEDKKLSHEEIWLCSKIGKVE